VCKKSWR